MDMVMVCGALAGLVAEVLLLAGVIVALVERHDRNEAALMSRDPSRGPRLAALPAGRRTTWWRDWSSRWWNERS